MGKGPSTKEQNVKKQLDFITSGGSGGRAKKPDSNHDACLFSVAFDTIIDSIRSKDISASTEVVLVLAPDGISIDVFIGSVQEKYEGPKTDQLVSCMKRNYIYEGVVIKVERGADKTTVSCSVTGHTK